MFLGTDKTYQLGKTALDVSALRQQTISHNIANVNTKDFKAKKVEFENTLKKAMNQSSSNLNISNSRHLGATSSLSDVEGKVYTTNENTKMNLDGNNVDIDLEMKDMAANQIQYNALIQNTSQKITDYRTAIQGR